MAPEGQKWPPKPYLADFWPVLLYFGPGRNFLITFGPKYAKERSLHPWKGDPPPPSGVIRGLTTIRETGGADPKIFRPKVPTFPGYRNVLCFAGPFRTQSEIFTRQQTTGEVLEISTLPILGPKPKKTFLTTFFFGP